MYVGPSQQEWACKLNPIYDNVWKTCSKCDSSQLEWNLLYVDVLRLCSQEQMMVRCVLCGIPVGIRFYNCSAISESDTSKAHSTVSLQNSIQWNRALKTSEVHCKGQCLSLFKNTGINLTRVVVFNLLIPVLFTGFAVFVNTGTNLTRMVVFFLLVPVLFTLVRSSGWSL